MSDYETALKAVKVSNDLMIKSATELSDHTAIHLAWQNSINIQMVIVVSNVLDRIATALETIVAKIPVEPE